MGERVRVVMRAQNGETPGWAGNAVGEILDNDPNRNFFGPNGEGPGPAYLVRLENGLKFWASESELDDYDGGEKEE